MFSLNTYKRSRGNRWFPPATPFPKQVKYITHCEGGTDKNNYVTK